MITDRIENLPLYKGIYPQLEDFIDFLLTNDLSSVIEKLVFNAITIIPIKSEKPALNFDSSVLEAHKSLMDIHITLKGLDVMAYADLEKESIITKEYDSVNDYLLAKSNKIKTLSIPENYFCIVPNNFAHMALYTGHSDVNKIVIKLKV